MEYDIQNVDNSLSIIHGNDNVQKADNKKGMSVTRALVLLGFDEWKNLEPGMINLFDYVVIILFLLHLHTNLEHH